MNVCINNIPMLNVYLSKFYEEYMNVCMNTIPKFVEYFADFMKSINLISNLNQKLIFLK